MIDGLPEKFNAVIAAWDVVAESQQTKENLKRMLLQTEARMLNVSENENVLSVTKVQ